MAAFLRAPYKLTQVDGMDEVLFQASYRIYLPKTTETTQRGQMGARI